jgi:RNA polymerase sigma-70 factor, ECF subfamily
VAQLPSMEEEFREFVAARSGALLRTAYLLAGDWSTAEDLLQTALTKTYLAWKRLGRIEAVEPYTRRVLVNTATSWWRRRWHGERPTEVLPERPGPDQHEQAVDRDLMWQYVRRLPARQRAVLVLRFYEDLSEAETADLLDIARGTVKSQTARALATLRRYLDEDGVMPTRHPGAPPPPATGLPTVAPVAAEEILSGEEIVTSGGPPADDGVPVPAPTPVLRSEPAAARRAGSGEGA